MNTIKKRTSFLFVAILLFVSCKKDSIDNNDQIPEENSAIWGNGISTKVYGTVTDENGVPVSGALVKARTSTTTTDRNGIFILSDIQAYKNLGYISVEKAGFFNGSRSFVPTTGGNQLNIRLLTKRNAGNVNGSTGGSITNAEGVKLELAPNSIVRDNSPYTGQINAAIRFINPESEQFQDEMPGNLIGVQDNQGRVLTSYGMVAVELTDNSGALLQIASGQTATVKFPIPTSLRASAPTSIDLWSFDETNGYWKHEGMANKVGNEYVAIVSHFSFWNCDIPTSNVRFDGQVLNASNQLPIAGANVTITSQTWGTRGGTTNACGFFGGLIPANETLTIQVSVLCGGLDTTVYTANIGPFNSNTTISPINITLPNTTTITGSVVDCNNIALNNGYVFANGQAYFMYNGSFSFATCGSNVSVQSMTASPWVVGQSQSVTLNGGTLNIGNLQVCGTAPNTFADIDGNTYPYIQIGTQTWSQTNLNVSRYRNGDPIPQVTDPTQWLSLTTGAWCWYNNDSATYAATYGRLYNWYAVNDARGLAPQGYHIPTDAEWNKLVKHLDAGADTTCVGCVQSIIAGGAMKSTTGWTAPNTGATNSSGFAGLPGGCRDSNGTFSYSIGNRGHWWSSTEVNAAHAWNRDPYCCNSLVMRVYSHKLLGFSVRCVRD